MTEHDALRRELEMLSDEELAAILQEKDEEQWRPEVFDIVAAILESRGISTRDLLDSGSEASEEGSEDLSEAWSERLITVAEYFNSLDAHADRLALEQAGLRAWVVGEYQGITEATLMKLQVRPGDLAAAMAVLEAPPVAASDLPPELALPLCPRCGSNDVTEEAEDLEVLDSASSSLSAARRQVWHYRCSSCRHTWQA